MSSSQCKEEQAMELEALESIFGADYAPVNGGVSIRLRPFSMDSFSENHVEALLTVIFGESYPNTPPQSIEVSSLKALKPSQCAEMVALAEAKARESAGSICIYELSECLRDYLIANNVKEVTSLRDHIQAQIEKEEAERRAREEEEAANKVEEPDTDSDDEEENDNPSTISIPPNTLVTNENFAEWNAAFMKEQAERRDRLRLLRGEVVVNTTQPTGKQLFLQNMLANFLGDDDDDDVDVEEVETEVEAPKEDDDMWINEGLFDDDDDVDMALVLGEDTPEDDSNTNTTVTPVSPTPAAAVTPAMVGKESEKSVSFEPESTPATTTANKDDKEKSKDKKKEDKKKDDKKKEDKKDDKKDKKKMSFKDVALDAGGFGSFGAGELVSMSDFLGDIQVSKGQKEKKEKLEKKEKKEKKEKV